MLVVVRAPDLSTGGLDSIPTLSLPIDSIFPISIELIMGQKRQNPGERLIHTIVTIQGRIQGGGGLGGLPNFIKRGKNVACVRIRRILVVNSNLDPPPFQESCIRPRHAISIISSHCFVSERLQCEQFYQPNTMVHQQKRPIETYFTGENQFKCREGQ